VTLLLRLCTCIFFFPHADFEEKRDLEGGGGGCYSVADVDGAFGHSHKVPGSRSLRNSAVKQTLFMPHAI